MFGGFISTCCGGKLFLYIPGLGNWPLDFAAAEWPPARIISIALVVVCLSQAMALADVSLALLRPTKRRGCCRWSFRIIIWLIILGSLLGPRILLHVLTTNTNIALSTSTVDAAMLTYGNVFRQEKQRQRSTMRMQHLTNLLNVSESEIVAHQVWELRDYWIFRALPYPIVPMFTLGFASYLDGVPHDSSVRAMNKLLSTKFGWLHDRVIQGLNKLFDKPIKPALGKSLPGFHIFMNHVAFEYSVASVHNDLQYMDSKMATDVASENNVFSFTLPIALPSLAGLNTFEKKQCNDTNIVTANVVDCADFHTVHPRFGDMSFCRQYHRYTVGELVVHHGSTVHQIAPSRYLAPKEVRLTLQGHGFCMSEYCAIYW